MRTSKMITLKNDVRAFTRSTLSKRTLSNGSLMYFKKGETLPLGIPETMVYDHREQTVVQVIGTNPTRFIILSELETGPWHETPTDPPAENN